MCECSVCIIAVKVISGSTKVVDFGTNRKRVYDFLLVVNSKLCRISHRFGDTATYWSKIANSYPPHPHSTPSLGVTPFEFWEELDIMMGLPYGEEIMIVGRTMWTQSTSVTDRRTDRQTDRITITDTVQRIASHGKNCPAAQQIRHHLPRAHYTPCAKTVTYANFSKLIYTT